jgi:hypothetical protein
MSADLPLAARLVAHLIPADDREWVVGDLLEDADDRGLHGVRRGASIACGAAAIAAGLSLQRARVWVVAALLFCGSVATLALGADVLFRILFIAAGL